MGAEPINVVSLEDESKLSESEQKWGKATWAAGHTSIPTSLILHFVELGMDAVDLAIVLFLASKWWKVGDAPFPKKKTIAEVVGIDASNVRKRLQNLERLKLVRREERRVAKDRNNSSVYHLTPLALALAPFGDADLAAKKAAQEAAANKPKPKVPRKRKPSLHVVTKS